MKNAINWFEIPVKDFARAKSFYETLFDEPVTEIPHPTLKYGMLPSDMQQGVGVELSREKDLNHLTKEQ